MEERLVKLEQILHKLFCCNSNQFQGPPGLQGEPGLDGAQGPQGLPGPIGPAGLVWQGEFVPCNIYQQNDAVGYNGASYYVTCEDTGTAECENPTENSCWALLANMGAVGSMGPQGITGTPGAKGIDGANSLRWVAGTNSVSTMSGPNVFDYNFTSFAALNTILISVKEAHGINVAPWLLDLFSRGNLAKLQITDSTDNSKFGTYNIIGGTNAGLGSPTGFLVLALTPVSGNGTIVAGREYTISFNYTVQGPQGLTGPIGLTGNIGLQGPQGVPGIQGPPGPGSSVKTYGLVSVSDNPYTTLTYSFNDVIASVENNQGILLPNVSEVGTEVVLFSSLDNYPFYVFTDNTEIHTTIRFKNIDNISEKALILPGDTYRFVLLSLIDDGKGNLIPLWFSEAINGRAYLFNDINLIEQGFQIGTVQQDLTLVPLTSAYLGSQFGPLRGVNIYCPNINLVYTNVGGGYWTEQPITTVL